MKKYFLVILSFLFINNFYSQNTLEKIELAFGKERFENLKNNYPDSLKFYEFVCTNGFLITEKNNISPEDLKKAIALNIPEEIIQNGIPRSELINIFLLPVKFNDNTKTIYSINNTNYFLILRSKEYLIKKYKSK
jgi:hypothetical protein